MAQAPGCICSEKYILESLVPLKGKARLKHSEACLEANEKSLDYQLYDQIAWLTHTGVCPDRGAHKAHGTCSGRTYDAT